MPNFIEAAIGAVRSATCAALSPDAAIGGLLNDAGILAGSAGVAAQAFRRQLCNDPSEFTSPGLSFTGGQCPTLYGVTVTYNTVGGRIGDKASGSYNGPITRIFLDSSQQQKIRIIANGVEGQVGSFSPAADQPSELTAATITRLDGAPDNCGNAPPGSYPPTPSVDAPITINYNNNNNDNFTAVGTLRLFAPVLLPGSIVPTFNFNLDLGGVDLTGNIDFNGKVSLEPQFNFGTGNDTPGGPDPEDEDETARNIIGAKVVSTITNNKFVGRISQDVNPDIYIPRLGSINFKHRVGRGSGWSTDISIKNLVEYIPCPEPGIAFAVAATPALGVSIAVTPIYQGPPRTPTPA
jgi:hypothetical protein